MLKRIFLLILLSLFISAPVFAVNNPCPNGQFLDPIDNKCMPLLGKFTGYNPAWEQNLPSTINVTECSESALNSALAQSKQQGGGVIKLPACTITIRSGNMQGVPGAGPWTYIPSNTILQGAGKDSTILLMNNVSGQMIGTKGAQNVVIRDLTVSGNKVVHNNVFLMFANNLLIERVKIKDAVRGGLYIKYGKDITIRYSDIIGPATSGFADHGIAINDCRPESGKIPEYGFNFNNGIGTVDEQLASPDKGFCAAEYNYYATKRQPIPNPATPVWTTNVLIYSNLIQNNGGYALDTHESDMEIVGNKFYNSYTYYATKFMDTLNLYYYRNHFKGSKIGPFQAYTKYNMPERTLDNIWLINNTYQDTGSLYFWIGWNYQLLKGSGQTFTPYKNIYLVYNKTNRTFRAINKVGTQAQVGTDAGFASKDNLKICVGSDDDTKVNYDYPHGYLSASICDLYKTGYYTGGTNPTPNVPTPTPTPTINEPTPTPDVPTPTPSQTNKYDVTENGVVDILDIIDVIKYLFGS